MKDKLNECLALCELADFIIQGLEMIENEDSECDHTIVRPLMSINNVQVQLVLTNHTPNIVPVPAEYTVIETLTTEVKH